MRSSEVAEPFRSDDRFWRSVTASVFALVTLLAAAVVTGFVGGWGALAFVFRQPGPDVSGRHLAAISSQSG